MEEVSGQFHVLPTALPRGIEPHSPMGQEAGYASEPEWEVWVREYSYHCPESNPGRPTRSPSLYLLSYPYMLLFGGTEILYLLFLFN
jgi:hypothetical protein